MSFKPFKPPGQKIVKNIEGSDFEAPEPKRRKLSPEPQVSKEWRPAPLTVTRSPLSPIRNLASPSSSNTTQASTQGNCYSVLWRKVTQKKNKTWDDDGYVCLISGQATLYDNCGKRLGQTSCAKTPENGVLLSIAGRDVEIGTEISKQDFYAATNQTGQSIQDHSQSMTHAADNVKARDLQANPKPMSLKEQMRQEIAKTKASKPAVSSKPLLAGSQNTAFKQPVKENNVLPQVPSEVPIPRHDPNTAGALVFKRPKKAPPRQQIVDVVLDPILTKHLRDHQRDGIKFLYECVMNLRNFGGQGCILADDMGLGKTLQTIALLWTLIKQNPIHKAEPVVKRALIVCPATLIQNWKKEFRKWLGRERLGVLTLDEKFSRLSMFDGRNHKVLIVSYERLRNIAEDLTKGSGVDIVICDEGHRLKTLQNKSANAIQSLHTPRRIILSGTPIQNDLSEFFAMVSFVNDGALGTPKGFAKNYEKPIMKSRQPNATEDDIENGQAASEELARATSPFILRRTADILAHYLPPRTEYVLFCEPTPEQSSVYKEVLKSPMFQNALGSSESALQLITILKKLCNSPALMRPDRGSDESTSSSSLSSLNEMLPSNIARYYHNSYSAKIRLLDELLVEIRKTTDDKVILVSNYTSTLNLMAQLLDSTGGRYLRLDGSVPQGKRQSLVEEFNRTSSSACFAFLLSAKAGGVGLNLIGANRLILFDVDWNPATDDQAMARIHREGQKKHCKIYRFLIKGGLEERIWQRQVVKRALADSILDSGNATGLTLDNGLKGKKGKAAFSREELRDLFRLDENEGLRTHDLIGCKCQGSGLPQEPASRASPDADDENGDDSLTISMTSTDATSFVPASGLTNEMIEDQEVLLSNGRHPRQAHSRCSDRQQNQELMHYVHLDTKSLPDLIEKQESEEMESVKSVVDDECLMRVLTRSEEVITGRVAYLFKKVAGPKIDVALN